MDYTTEELDIIRQIAEDNGAEGIKSFLYEVGELLDDEDLVDLAGIL